MSDTRRRALAVIGSTVLPILILTSCSDDSLLSPRGKSALKAFADPTATMIVPVATYLGQPAATAFGASALSTNGCRGAFQLNVQRVSDNTDVWGQTFCDATPTTVDGLDAGLYRVSFIYFDETFRAQRILISTVSLPANATTTLPPIELSGFIGLVTGTVKVNGVAPADDQYQICPIDIGGTCSTVMGGTFTSMAQTGAGSFTVVNPTGVELGTFSYTAAAGQTVSAFVDSTGATLTGGISIVDPTGTVIIPVATYGGLAALTGFGGASALVTNGCAGAFQLNIKRLNDDVDVWGQAFCNTTPTTVPDLQPGDYSVSFVYFDATFTQQRIELSTFTLAPNQTLTLPPVELNGLIGLLTGTFRVNGSVPADNLYSVCPIGTGGFCSSVVGGRFTAMARAGAGSFQAINPAGVVLSTFTYLTVPGTSISVFVGNGAVLGGVQVTDQSATMTIPVATYNGQSAATAFGATSNACRGGFQLTVERVSDGAAIVGQSFCTTTATTVSNLSPGDYRVSFVYFDATAHQQKIVLSTVTVPPGVTTTVPAISLTSLVGLVTGTVKVNGTTPANNLYNICPTGAGTTCSPVVGGAFTIVVRPGTGTFAIADQSGQIGGTYTYIATAGQSVSVGAIANDTPGATPVGTTVNVHPVNGGVGSSNTDISLTFHGVTVAGITTVTQSATGTAVPAGYLLGAPPVFYTFSTTAKFTGLVDVCINYTGTNFVTPTNIKLLGKNASGAWVLVTATVDRTNHIVCASVSSLSTYVLVEGSAVVVGVGPTVTPIVTGTVGTNGWYTSNVSVRWLIDDHGSKLSTKACKDESVKDDTAGITLSCTATNAGGTVTQSVTIKRDATRPAIAYSGNKGFYGLGATVSITCSASDALSGLASNTCVPITGPAYQFAFGRNSYTAQAVDRAGNSNSARAEFTIGLTAADFEAIIRLFVTDPKVQKRLLDRLDNIFDKRDKGNDRSRSEKFKNFLKELDKAKADHCVSAQHAALLAALAALLG